MMLSDYYAISTCAISILIVPFLIIAQMRFSHIMQTEGYENKNFFKYIKSSFKTIFIPLIIITAICILNNVAIQLYVKYTTLYEMGIIIGFMLLVMIVCAIISVVFYIYVKTIKIESEKKPLKMSNKFISVFLISCVIICAITVLENVFISLDYITYVLPLLTPLFVPLANAITGKKVKLEEE